MNIMTKKHRKEEIYLFLKDNQYYANSTISTTKYNQIEDDILKLERNLGILVYDQRRKERS